jgi:hypothetical protein
VSLVVLRDPLFGDLRGGGVLDRHDPHRSQLVTDIYRDRGPGASAKRVARWRPGLLQQPTGSKGLVFGGSRSGVLPLCLIDITGSGAPFCLPCAAVMVARTVTNLLV